MIIIENKKIITVADFLNHFGEEYKKFFLSLHVDDEIDKIDICTILTYIGVEYDVYRGNIYIN